MVGIGHLRSSTSKNYGFCKNVLQRLPGTPYEGHNLANIQGRFQETVPRRSQGPISLYQFTIREEKEKRMTTGVRRRV
jgi:hypothetical protein